MAHAKLSGRAPCQRASFGRVVYAATVRSTGCAVPSGERPPPLTRVSARQRADHRGPAQEQRASADQKGSSNNKSRPAAPSFPYARTRGRSGGGLLARRPVAAKVGSPSRLAHRPEEEKAEAAATGHRRLPEATDEEGRFSLLRDDHEHVR